MATRSERCPVQRRRRQQHGPAASAASVPRERSAPVAELRASVYPSISSLAGEKPRHPRARSHSSGTSRCRHAKPSHHMSHEPIFNCLSLLLPLCSRLAQSSMKQQGVKENKNSCRDKGVRLSPGPDPGQGARTSHVQAILGLDLVSEHLTGSERKRTQAGGRASPAPQIISTADSQMLICHFR